jgi:hypothetical protein
MKHAARVAKRPGAELLASPYASRQHACRSGDPNRHIVTILRLLGQLENVTLVSSSDGPIGVGGILLARK